VQAVKSQETKIETKIEKQALIIHFLGDIA